MPKLLFAWLGSGRTRRREVGAAARHLDQAARAGLPVPPGAVLLDEVYRLAIANDLAADVGSRVVVTDPLALWATIFESIHLPRFDRPVEAGAVPPDPNTHLPAGQPDVVDTADPNALGQALAAAWSLPPGADPAARRDVLLLETVAAVTCGSATGRAAVEHDERWYAGTEDSRPEPLARLRAWQPPDETLPPDAQRLQMLLRGVRHSLGQGDWQIAWADDGHICWLRAVYPLPGPAR
jgi:hypothetical protein